MAWLGLATGSSKLFHREETDVVTSYPPCGESLTGYEPPLRYFDDMERYYRSKVTISRKSAPVWDAAWLAEQSMKRREDLVPGAVR